ncbi:MAG: hypothetical protein IPI87_01810 [Betaproteobacteria bacterium]|nr:hypothetical protein [Betaproteobacteria bacterium]
MDWLLDLWLAELQPRLEQLWSSLDFWRALALGLLTFLAALAAFRKPLLRRLTRRGLAPRDRELFRRLLQVLPAEGSIAFIGNADFGNAFDRRRLDDLNNFYYSWDNPEHRFLDQALEEKRMELFVAVVQFLDAVRLHAATDPAGVQSVVPVNADCDADLPERIREGVRQLNGAAKAVVTIHQEIVLLGRMQVP